MLIRGVRESRVAAHCRNAMKDRSLVSILRHRVRSLRCSHIDIEQRTKCTTSSDAQRAASSYAARNARFSLSVGALRGIPEAFGPALHTRSDDGPRVPALAPDLPFRAQWSVAPKWQPSVSKAQNTITLPPPSERRIAPASSSASTIPYSVGLTLELSGGEAVRWNEGLGVTGDSACRRRWQHSFDLFHGLLMLPHIAAEVIHCTDDFLQALLKLRVFPF
jgi:hypothetical protein